jgi:hypothetical protein
MKGWNHLQFREIINGRQARLWIALNLPKRKVKITSKKKMEIVSIVNPGLPLLNTGQRRDDKFLGRSN